MSSLRFQSNPDSAQGQVRTVTRGPCTAGCKPEPGAKNRYHDNLRQCPYQPEYDPNAKGAIDKEGNLVTKMRAKAMETPSPPGGTAPPQNVPRPPAASGLRLSDRPAEVLDTSKKKLVKPPEPVDFVVDAAHTRGAIQKGFAVVYQVTVWFDEWLEWKDHMPKEQFAPSELALMSIENEPRNMYARGVTWVCIRLGAKTQAQAHHLLDTAFIFADFGGFFVVLVNHYRIVVRDSPKLKRMRAAKKAGVPAAGARRGFLGSLGLSREQKAAAIDVTPADGGPPLAKQAVPPAEPAAA